MSTQRSNSNRRLSRSSSERIIFYMEDAPYETSYNPSLDVCQQSCNCNALCSTEDRSSFYPSCHDRNEFELNGHSAIYLSSLDDEPRHNVSTRSKTSSQKQNRKNSELDQRSGRRSSVQSNRSRINSCSRPTPLGRKQLGHQTFRSMRNERSLLPHAFTDVITIRGRGLFVSIGSSLRYFFIGR